MILATQNYTCIYTCIYTFFPHLDNSGKSINPTVGILYHANVFNSGYFNELSN